MSVSKPWSVRAAALVLAALALPACGKHIGTPLISPMTEAEADANIAARLENNQKTHKQITELRDAFKKAETVLKSVSTLLGKTLNQEPGQALVGLVADLPNVFKSLSYSVVKTELDGTWSVETPILAGLSLSAITQCQSPRARLTGKRVVDQIDVVLYVSDCNGANWDRLAKWIVKPDGAIEMTYWPLVMANLRPIAVGVPDSWSPGRILGSCNFSLSAGRKELALSCSRARASDSEPSVFGTFAIRDVPEGTSASIALGLEPGGMAWVTFEPHQTPHITLCGEEGGKNCVTL
jgi:hypothetical protein